MTGKEQILVSVKSLIQLYLPDAQILLFGSRVNDTATSESDWDILVITTVPVSQKHKAEIYNTVFPLSVSIGAFINLLLVSKNDWMQNPSWYSLRQNIAHQSILL
jgi:DNA polymerase sigma